MSTDVAIVLGTRPEIIRFAPIIKELNDQKSVSTEVVYTGQHYSPEMSNIFFEDLNLELPKYTISLNKKNPVEQTAEIIQGLATVFDELKPKIVCVWGDTNSSLSAGLAANKMRIKIMHIEAGCRSGDFSMSEEYNRIILDHISDFLIPLSKHDKENLQKELVHGEIYLAGDPLLDIFLNKKKSIKRRGLANQYKKNKYLALFTLHRAENVDSKTILKNILIGITNSLAKYNNCDVILPLHPRTKKMLQEFGFTKLIKSNFVNVTEPLGYDDIVEVLTDVDFVITDSGGLQKEAFFAKRPCITLRKSTEWVDTVKLKANKLIDPISFKELPNIENFVKTGNALFKKTVAKPYGDGNATEKIVGFINSRVNRD